MTDAGRENRTTTPAEIFAKMFPGRDYATAHAFPAPNRSLTTVETHEFHRDRAVSYFRRHVPRHYTDAAASHPQVTAWTISYLRDILDARWLMLLGDTGTGKTHQAYGALRFIADSGSPLIPWQATTAADLYARLRPGAHADTETEFAGIANAPLLLLDDLGATRLSEFTEEMTYRLIDHRYTNGLATIITSNLVPGEFANRFGARTASRMREMCTRVNLGVEDRRASPETAA